MKKQYQLRSIKRNRTSDFLSIDASLFLGHRRIGSLTTCSDTEAFVFQFELATDRLVFEHFIADWWSSEDRTTHLSLIEKTIISVTLSDDPVMAVKQRCWIRSMVEQVKATSIDPRASMELNFA